MTESAVTHATFVIERSYAASPAKVFAAFADPAKKRRWYAGDRGPLLEAQQTDFRIGGHDRTIFRMGEDTPLPGEAIVNDTVYQDIVPDRRIVFAYTMSMKGRPFSASLSTVELLASGQGTQLIFTEQAAFFENSDGPKMREEGWSGLLDSLGRELAA